MISDSAKTVHVELIEDAPGTLWDFGDRQRGHHLGVWADDVAAEADRLDALVDLLRDEYGWEIGTKNVALTNGSQTAFFFLFNLFAGTYGDGSHKKILLPLAPEYMPVPPMTARSYPTPTLALS